MRELTCTMITTYDQDHATATTGFHRAGGEAIGRQSQTCLRTPAGWRVVAAHVSFMASPAGPR